VVAVPLLLDGLELLAHLREPVADRGDQRVDRLLAVLQVRAGAALELAQAGARQIEEGLVVALERIGRERVEGVAQRALVGRAGGLGLGPGARLAAPSEGE